MKWNHLILLGGVDVTSRCALSATVLEAENASALADITYRPLTGTQDPDGLRHQPLAIRADVGAGMEPLFGGAVIRALWDTRERVYTIRASNKIQDYFRALGSEAAVLAELPGAVYSDAFMGEPPDDLWEYAERCLESVEYDVHIDRAGLLAIVPWSAKGVADVALTAGQVHNNGAFELSLPDADQQINQVVAEYDYRNQRFKVRSHLVSWQTSVCAWLAGEGTAGAAGHIGFDAPTVDVVANTLLGSSWYVPGVFYTHPETGAFEDYCYSGHSWTNDDNPEAPQIVLGAGGTGRLGLTQPIFETYRITVRAAASQAAYGAVVSERRGGSRDVDAPEYPVGAPALMPEWSVDTIGDMYSDNPDDAARANDLQAFYQWASARCAGSHRQTAVTFQVDLDPWYDLSRTVEVECFGLRAKGKVRQVRYVLGAAPYTELTLALSRGFGGTTTPWVVPGRSSAPNDPISYWQGVNGGGYSYPTPLPSTLMSTLIGNSDSSAAVPDPDDRVNAWITNYSVAIGSPDPDQIYSPEFRVLWPAVEPEAETEIKILTALDYEIALDQDLLEVD